MGCCVITHSICYMFLKWLNIKNTLTFLVHSRLCLLLQPLSLKKMLTLPYFYYSGWRCVYAFGWCILTINIPLNIRLVMLWMVDEFGFVTGNMRLEICDMWLACALFIFSLFGEIEPQYCQIIIPRPLSVCWTLMCPHHNREVWTMWIQLVSPWPCRLIGTL